jgi:hypothetical protein
MLLMFLNASPAACDARMNRKREAVASSYWR